MYVGTTFLEPATSVTQKSHAEIAQLTKVGKKMEQRLASVAERLANTDKSIDNRVE